jgi:energy-converting hydrogenase Eha subunit B
MAHGRVDRALVAPDLVATALAWIGARLPADPGGAPIRARSPVAGRTSA